MFFSPDICYVGCFDSRDGVLATEAITTVESATQCLIHCAAQTPVSSKQWEDFSVCLKRLIPINILWMDNIMMQVLGDIEYKYG